MKLYFMI
jgi:hypothetical protein